MPKEGGKQVTLVLARSCFSVVRPLAVRCHAKRFVLIRLFTAQRPQRLYI